MAVTTTVLTTVNKSTVSRRVKAATDKTTMVEEEVVAEMAVVAMVEAMEAVEEVAVEDIIALVLTVEVNVFHIFFVIKAS